MTSIPHKCDNEINSLIPDGKVEIVVAEIPLTPTHFYCHMQSAFNYYIISQPNKMPAIVSSYIIASSSLILILER